MLGLLRIGFSKRRAEKKRAWKKEKKKERCRRLLKLASESGIRAGHRRIALWGRAIADMKRRSKSAMERRLSITTRASAPREPSRSACMNGRGKKLPTFLLFGWWSEDKNNIRQSLIFSAEFLSKKNFYKPVRGLVVKFEVFT